jgi:ribonuclease BN (tRNA processing enzyme)
LLEHCADGEVDAVVVTHEHPDHCVDVSALARVRHYQAPEAEPIPLYCPPGVLDVLRALEPSPDPASVFDVRDLIDGEIGPFRLTTVLLPHYKTNLGVRLSAPGLTFSYTGDTGPSSGLPLLAEGADLFVCDATHQEPPIEGPRFLMTAREAGSAAAGARRLLLTHFWPGSDRALSVAQARENFAGEVIAAEEGLVLDLS